MTGSLVKIVLDHGYDTVIVGRNIDLNSTEMVDLRSIPGLSVTVYREGSVVREKTFAHQSGKGPRSRWGGVK